MLGTAYLFSFYRHDLPQVYHFELAEQKWATIV